MFLFSFSSLLFLISFVVFSFHPHILHLPFLIFLFPIPHTFFLRGKSDIIICRSHLSFLNWVSWGASRGLRAETKVEGARDEVRQTVWARTASTVLPNSLHRDCPQLDV